MLKALAGSSPGVVATLGFISNGQVACESFANAFRVMIHTVHDPRVAATLAGISQRFSIFVAQSFTSVAILLSGLCNCSREYCSSNSASPGKLVLQNSKGFVSLAAKVINMRFRH
ncbi:MAG: hypothetical protein H0V18_17685 [Pyrinomonadaceae bacterium]|nr:hypothetical protein [Pyrinomonadaceae bacterium]